VASLALDAPRSEVLAHAGRLIADAWTSFDHARDGQPPIDDATRALLRADLPEHATPANEVLEDAARVLDESLAQSRPRWFGFVGSSGLEIGVIGDLLASCYDINLAIGSEAASHVERQALRWVGELVGYPGSGGACTSGGMLSNLTALAAARERALPGSRRRGISGMPAAI
jgi:aromatic-L-amino-acid/L-tryptophan decarboxylase